MDALADLPRAVRPRGQLAALLEGAEGFIRRYVVLSEPQATAVTLWVAHTHALDAAEVSPYLAVTSPEKRSGKTRLLEVLELLVARPWRIVTPSEAVLFRKINAERSTVLLDEADAIFRDRGPTYEGLRALLNAGHRRGAVVSRCVGEGAKQELRDFRVFSAKAIAGIGELPDTVADRSIPIRLARRAPHEAIERFRYRDAAQQGAALCEALTQELSVDIEALREIRSVIPNALNDRATECWEPLLAIADQIGGEWPKRARAAAEALHGDPLAVEETAGIQLLAAIREAFDSARADRLSTAALLKVLVERDDGPWAEWWGRAVASGETRGPGFKLARLLRRYGISRRTIRLDADTRAKGYLREDFEDSFARYLGPPPRQGDTVTIQPQSREGASPRPNTVTLPKSLNAGPDADCHHVTSSEARTGAQRVFD